MLLVCACTVVALAMAAFAGLADPVVVPVRDRISMHQHASTEQIVVEVGPCSGQPFVRAFGELWTWTTAHVLPSRSVPGEVHRGSLDRASFRADDGSLAFPLRRAPRAVPERLLCAGPS